MRPSAPVAVSSRHSRADRRPRHHVLSERGRRYFFSSSFAQQWFPTRHSEIFAFTQRSRQRPCTPHEQRSLLIAYATEPGNVAIFQTAKALAEELVKPGLEAGQVFRAVA
jgi:hypothetical protein